MLTQKFFKLFPPPKFLNIPHAGLDLNDDAVRIVEYGAKGNALYIHRYGERKLNPGIIESGLIKDEEVLQKVIESLAKEMKVGVVKVSLPEEKMYLFKTEVPSTDENEIRQNIEFKLEENVPLAPGEAVFFFDFIPSISKEGKILASVSVAPLDLVTSYLRVLKAAHLTVLSFEIQAKAIARSLVPNNSNETHMILNIMNYKTGIYIVFGGVVCFTSTISWGALSLTEMVDKEGYIKELKKDINKIYTYWTEHGEGTSINRIFLSGHAALTTGLASHLSPDPKIPVEIGRVWQNAFSIDSYIPPLSFEESLDYSVAAGLAL